MMGLEVRLRGGFRLGSGPDILVQIMVASARLLGVALRAWQLLCQLWWLAMW